MRIGRLIASAGALTMSGLLLAPGAASAHTAEVVPTCDGLTIRVFLYPEGVTTSVTIDGQPQAPRSDGEWTVPWNPLQDHTYEVFVDGADGTQFDREFEGSHEACPPSTTTVPGGSTTTTAPGGSTTTVPGGSTTTTAPGVTTTTAPGGSTTTAAPGVTTTTAPGSVGGTSGTVPRGSGGTGGSRGGGGGGSLPATGYGTGPLAAAGAVALVMGGAMLLAGRRRSTS